ncbi:uncharacterized protein STEHIDRAFT_107339 [Stereum hirsutum FP-91666 SS1]|uniref:uncharacterized protein n=1 Tax=Stereum hirsutum (strain FP-91666) TaxID=721885 RepID=UPI000440CB6B|nr:uncharacterized protein STEHIDRAFT_107339 [Stereum hirsutum FP-91666 SS1]EIM90557.1 hypothetical protein STEHIDRAFT_107339 [Stereum hirsutum FP-91666 SS1]
MADSLRAPEPSYFMSPMWKSQTRLDSPNNSVPGTPITLSTPGTPNEGSSLQREKTFEPRDLKRSLFKLNKPPQSTPSAEYQHSRETSGSFYLTTRGWDSHSTADSDIAPTLVRTELEPIEEPYDWGPSTEDKIRGDTVSGTSSYPSGSSSNFSAAAHPQNRTSDSFYSFDEAVVFDEDGDEVPQVPALWDKVDPQIPTGISNPSMVTLPRGTGPTTHPWVDAPPFNVIDRPTPVDHKFRATFKITVSLAVVISLVIGYAVKLKIVTIGFWSFGMYGVLLCIDFAVQATVASVNRARVNKISKTSDVVAEVERPKALKAPGADITEQVARMRQVFIAVVGYREDEEAWIKCLQSLQAQDYPIKHIIGVVDENDGPDLDMATAFGKAFPEDECLITYWETIKEMGCRTPTRWEFLKMWFTQAPREGQEEAHVVAWNHILAGMGQLEWNLLFAAARTQAPRHAMFTSFVVGTYALGTRDAMLTTDSDTYVHPDAVTHLLALLMSDVRMAGVTGDVRIWNKDDSFLALMSSLRYWFAFKPFRGVLNASFSASRELFPLRRILSGPLGLYKTSDLMSVLGPWILQSFLGKETTFGDDRHLTNRILSLGHWTGYLHLAKCESDTPAGFVRWVKQQTRWSKSFFREALVPEEFCLVYLPRDWIYPLLWLGTMFGVALIKSTYGVICMRDPTYFLFSIYGFMYFFGLLPSKIFAGLTVGITTWGTSARSKTEFQRPESLYSRTTHIGHLVLWYSSLAVGLAYFLSSIFQIRAIWCLSLLCFPPIVHLYQDVIIGETRYAFYLLKKWYKKRSAHRTTAPTTDLEKSQLPGKFRAGNRVRFRMPTFRRTAPAPAASSTSAPSLESSSSQQLTSRSASTSSMSHSSLSAHVDIPTTIIDGLEVPSASGRRRSIAVCTGIDEHHSIAPRT